MPDILAAGVIVTRPGREVLLVHRPKYDDWSFPKGKLDRAEHPTAAAVREVAEETGLRVRLGVPLGTQRYPVGQRTKRVYYWTGRVVGDDDVSGYRPNAEIDEVRWVPLDDAPELLSYDRDAATLREALGVRRTTRAVVVLRHARARARSAWRGEDPARPLLQSGTLEAERLVPVLAAYGLTRVVTSTSLRCVQTVQPYAESIDADLDPRRRLSEEHAQGESIAALVEDLLADAEGAVVCTHRPVLDLVYDALGLDVAAGPGELQPAEMLVLHLHRDTVVAVERHHPRWVG